MARSFRYNIRDLWEADPVRAGNQVDFEEREADPSQFAAVPGQKLHPAAEMQDEAGGEAAPYEGAPMAGMPQGGMPGQPPADQEMQPIEPGTGQGQGPMTGQPPMQEGFDMDSLDIYLNELLDESVDEITEAPFDDQLHGPPSSYYRGNTAGDLNRQEYARVSGTPYTPAGGGSGAYSGLGGDLERSTRSQRGGGGGNYGGPARGGGGRAGPALAAPDPNIVRQQQHLQSLGYELGPTGADGRMGKYTQSATDAAAKHGYGFTKSGDMSYTGDPRYMTNDKPAAGGAKGDPETGYMGAAAAAAGLGANALARNIARGTQVTPPAGAGMPPVGNRGAQLLNPGGAPPANPGAGMPPVGNRGAQLLNPGAPGTGNPAVPAGGGAPAGGAPAGNPGAGMPPVGNRGAQLLNPGGTPAAAAEEPGLLGRGYNAAKGAITRGAGAVGDALGSVGGAISRGTGAAGEFLGTAGRAAAPYMGTAGRLAMNPAIGGVAMAMTPSATSSADAIPMAQQGKGQVYQPPAGWDKAPPPPARDLGGNPSAGKVAGSQPPAQTTDLGGNPATRTGGGTTPPPAATSEPQIASVKSQPVPESVMTWKDYMSLFESEKR